MERPRLLGLFPSYIRQSIKPILNLFGCNPKAMEFATSRFVLPRGESAGDKWEFEITPILGRVFGRTNGIAPVCKVLLSYRKKIEASISNEYVFDTTSKSGNYYYSWPQLTYSPTDWFYVEAVAQHTAASSGASWWASRKKWELTTYVFEPGSTGGTMVLEWGVIL